MSRKGAPVSAGGPTAPLNAVRLVLPWPPTTNNLYATVNGRRVKSAAGRMYEERVRLAIWTMFDHRRPADSWPLRPPYRISIELHAPKAMRYDVANREKAVMDALFAAIEQDDSVVDELLICRREPSREQPGCVVVVEELRRALGVGG